MGGAIPSVCSSARLDQMRREVQLLQASVADLAAECDELRRHLTAAVQAGFSLAQELVERDPPAPPPEDPIFRAIRQSR